MAPGFLPTIRRAGPAVAACVRFEVEGAGTTGVVFLAGWYNSASGRAGPAACRSAPPRFRAF